MFDTSQANCLGVDPELFFPDNSMEQQVQKMLIKICANCPIFTDCYDYALHVKVDGYWAGTFPRQRAIKRKELGIEPVRLDTQYKEQLMAQTPAAKQARAKRSRIKEQ